jgi:hypothetical protein
LNDLLKKDWTTLKFFDNSSEAMGEGETLENWKMKEKTSLGRETNLHWTRDLCQGVRPMLLSW